MRRIEIGGLSPVPWKNGGGLTREIALSADDRGVIWRLSLADVARDGPFSHFPGMIRVLTVIEGAGLALNYAGGVIGAAPYSPMRFLGDIAIDCRLIDGPVRDFNLIYDPARVALDVVRLGAGTHRLQGLGVLPLDGTAAIEASGAAAAGDFLLFETDEPQRVAIAGSTLAVIASSGARRE